MKTWLHLDDGHLIFIQIIITTKIVNKFLKLLIIGVCFLVYNLTNKYVDWNTLDKS